MIKTTAITIAIGVCAEQAANAYDATVSIQSKEWHDLRSAVYHLTELLERTARTEVTQ